MELNTTALPTSNMQKMFVLDRRETIFSMTSNTIDSLVVATQFEKHGILPSPWLTKLSNISSSVANFFDNTFVICSEMLCISYSCLENWIPVCITHFRTEFTKNFEHE